MIDYPVILIQQLHNCIVRTMKNMNELIGTNYYLLTFSLKSYWQALCELIIRCNLFAKKTTTFVEWVKSGKDKLLHRRRGAVRGISVLSKQITSCCKTATTFSVFRKCNKFNISISRYLWGFIFVGYWSRSQRTYFFQTSTKCFKAKLIE